MTDPLPIINAKSHLCAVTETTWGTLPGSPTYIHIPVESYTGKFEAVNRQGKPFVGNLTHKHNRNIKGMPKKQIVSRLYGWHETGTVSLARFLLDWLFEQPADSPASKSIEWAVGPNADNVRDLGMRCNQAVLDLSEQNGIMVTGDLLGRSQVPVATAQTVPNDRDRLVEYLFEHSTLELDGSAIPFGGLRRTLQRALKEFYYNGTSPQVLRPTDYLETIQLVKPHEDDTWADVLRSFDPDDSHELILTIRGLHMGTGATGDYDVAEITWPAVSFITKDDSVGHDELSDETINFIALKPDTSSAQSAIAWSEE